MQETEVTVFIYSQEPFEAHISAEALENGINQTNVFKIFNGQEKPQKGIVVKFKFQDGSKKFVRA
jgi:hypothetical protein